MRRSRIRLLPAAVTTALMLAAVTAGCSPGGGKADRPGAGGSAGGRSATSPSSAASSSASSSGAGAGGDRRPTTLQGIPLASGTHRLQLDAGGPAARSYLLHVPPAVADGAFRGGRPVRRAPLVLALHGGLADMAAMERLSGFSALADRKGFLVAYPNGLGASWNAGGCCGLAKVTGVDDVGFLTRLIDTLVATGLADPDRVYATGFSNGAGMALRLACAGGGRLAAAGSVSGSQIGSCRPARPVSILIVHGTADRRVPIAGGGDRDFNDKRPLPAVSTVVDFWRRTDRLPALSGTARSASLSGHGGLGGAGQTRPVQCASSGPATGSGPATATAKARAEVAFCRIDGGPHQWPATAAAALWDFFAPHARVP